MSKIYFIRHAKAVKEDKDGEKDFMRKLSERGKDDTKVMSNELKKQNIKPDIIISSDAKRCEQTAKILADELKFKGKITFAHELYDIDFNDMLKFIKNIDEKYNEIFIIGHNPTTTQTAEFISNSSIDNIPTAGVFCIDLQECKLADVDEGCGRVVFFKYPKKYKK
ncbi:histidine phosphatase family protein [Campylobacter sp. faydin G-24]|uniref:Histidine phosphatase family protein n=1 Tax=Campylobacter anatolicus TaxID=2829105 RepID=A0ABS5HI53_9BACT|nr:histidine phosphatase family protein [Campylobacter anatolicus]MBR8463941.1 histidine phosphatase family protein [Campylobacter anatolicus]